jgi:hypothetical protein
MPRSPGVCVEEQRTGTYPVTLSALDCVLLGAHFAEEERRRALRSAVGELETSLAP